MNKSSNNEAGQAEGDTKPAPAQFMAGLRADHAEYSRILSLLSREVSQLTESPRATLRLLREAFQFITVYLDTYHHPREDVLYERLAQRSRRSARVLSTLRFEHKVGTLMTRRIFSEIHELLLASTAGRLAKLANEVDRFVDQARDHIGREERLMYSQAPKLLNDKDWQAIEKEAPQLDPRTSLTHGGGRSYPILSHYFRSTAPPRLIPGDGALVTEGLRLDKAGALYGNFVGRTLEAMVLAGRQNSEAFRLAFRSARALCSPRSPSQFARAVRSIYRLDAAAVTRWTGEWREHFALAPAKRRRRTPAAASVICH